MTFTLKLNSFLVTEKKLPSSNYSLNYLVNEVVNK